MNTSDITRVILIFFIFSILKAFSKLSTEYSNIVNNWAKYRCKPSIMLFADSFGHDAYENFTYCIKNMQGSFIEQQLKETSESINVQNANMSTANTAFDSSNKKNQTSRDTSKGIGKFATGVLSGVIVSIKRIFAQIKSIVFGAKAAVGSTANTAKAGGAGFFSIIASVVKKVTDFPNI